MAGEKGATRDRILNKLQYAAANKASTITPASGDLLFVVDISADYEVGVAETANLSLADLGAIATAVVVGEDDTGYDVTFFGATSGQQVFWDESADTLNLDCTVQVDGTVTVGEDDTGFDVIFYGATSGQKVQWDESADTLIVDGDISLTGSFQNDKTTAVSADTTPTVLTFTGGLNLVSNTNDADDIVDLPVNTAGDIGKEIELYAVEGFEIQSADASATLNGVLIGATNEAAVAAGTYLRLKCVADNTWLSIISTLADGTQTKLVPDAA
jgi:hypothetical protein